MPSCGVADCYLAFTDGATCSACRKEYHFQCAGITEAGYRKLGDRRSTWRCLQCKQNNSPGLGSSTSASATVTTDTSMGAEVLSEIKRMANKLNVLDSMVGEMKALRADVTDVKASMAETSADLKLFSEKIRVMDERLSIVENSSTRVVDLEAKINELESQLDNKEQWTRMSNVEIKGIPENKNENLYEIVAALGNKVQFPDLKTQINFITRVPTRNKDNSKPIIVGFLNRFVKEDFVAAARMGLRNSPFRPIDLGYQGSNRIFVNDHLTTKNKMLLSSAKIIANEKGFQYIWSSHCKIMVRKDGTSPIIHIKTEKDLLKIK